MAITITGGEGASRKADTGETKKKIRRVKSEDFSPDKFEVYGRLDLNLTQIAQLERITPAQVSQIMRHPDLRDAYNVGRAQCVVALRQKVLSVGLAGDSRVLLHAATHLGELTEDRDRGLPDHYDPGQHSWDGAFKSKMENLRQKYMSEDDPGSEASGG